ncbi:MAG: hypothetical protein SO125_01765 [Eubacteriales bacterium]|nr:hypothetical protein [Eubacteriales bacterium]
MMSIKKSIHEWTNLFDKRAEMFAFHHPYLAYFVMFIVMPVLVLVAVFIGTAIIAFPMAWIMGWL